MTEVSCAPVRANVAELADRLGRLETSCSGRNAGVHGADRFPRRDVLREPLFTKLGLFGE